MHLPSPDPRLIGERQARFRLEAQEARLHRQAARSVGHRPARHVTHGAFDRMASVVRGLRPARHTAAG